MSAECHICNECCLDCECQRLSSLQPVQEHVNHPEHYQGTRMEVIDVIEDFNLGFNLGNAVKYILRSERKTNKNQDLEKAIWYLLREIK